MEKYAPKQPELIEEQKRLFKEAMQNVYNVFGPNSGRLYITPSETSKEKGGGWDKKFSIAALEIQASALWGQNPAKVQKIADQIQEHFLFFLLTNNAIQEAISKATGGSTPTKLRWTAFKAIVDPLINDVEIEPRFFSLAMRQKMYETNPICALCGNKIHALEDCAVDHITPYIRGGTTTPENGQLTHRSCNAIKHAKIPDLHP
jgi:5-methylcytosine-specific restriction endonuclease McrA